MPVNTTISIQNCPIFCQWLFPERRNEQPTLVFLHEALGSVAQWKDFPLLLAQKTGLPALLYDRHGHGRSGARLQPRDRDDLHREALEILPRVLDHLHIQRPILIGHSDGGTIALLYGARFSPLALICEAAHIFVEEETIKGIKAARQQGDLLIHKLRKYHGTKTEALFTAWAQTWLDPAFRNWSIEEELSGIHCPTLLLQGDEDEYASANHLKRIQDGIGPAAHAMLLEHCGHIPHLQAGEETLEKMSNFIRRVLLSSPSDIFI